MMDNMNKQEFYKYYIPALIKALEFDNVCDGFYTKGPEQYIILPDDKMKEIDMYLDKSSGKDSFLDKVAYYFDAKSHNFNKINGVLIEDYKRSLEKELILIEKKFNIT